MEFKTEQEAFWAGEFGEDYINRNKGDTLLASNLNFFSRALARAGKVDTCIEFGANIGMNLRALRLLYPALSASGVEINAQAAEQLTEVIPASQIHQQSILDFVPQTPYELSLIKGVLIHIDPEWLPKVYDLLYASSARYILMCEYYNPSPMSLVYRGHSDRLFKRDFCGELMDRHGDLDLIDYGFVYRRDPVFPQDDITWFLLEKRG